MTVRAIADQEWAQVSARKARIAAQSERNATRAAELIAEKLENEDVPLNVLVPVFGVSVDKAIALRPEAALTISFDHDHHHVHEFVQRHTTPMSAQEILDALPTSETTSHSGADTPQTAT